MADRWRSGWPVVVAAAAPLAVRLAGTYVRFLARRRRGVRVFRQALLAGGLTPAQAAVLSHVYEEASSVRRILKASR